MNSVGYVLATGKVMVRRVVIRTNRGIKIKMIKKGDITLMSFTCFFKLNFVRFFRFQHYLKRYGCHKKSLKMEQGLASGTGSVKGKMNTLQNMGMSWNDVRLYTRS